MQNPWILLDLVKYQKDYNLLISRGIRGCKAGELCLNTVTISVQMHVCTCSTNHILKYSIEIKETSTVLNCKAWISLFCKNSFAAFALPRCGKYVPCIYLPHLWHLKDVHPHLESHFSQAANDKSLDVK